MENKVILETKRLILRPWEETDAEVCYQYAKDPRSVRLLAGRYIPVWKTAGR